jgi:hypothetical protein
MKVSHPLCLDARLELGRRLSGRLRREFAAGQLGKRLDAQELVWKAGLGGKRRSVSLEALDLALASARATSSTALPIRVVVR